MVATLTNDQLTLLRQARGDQLPPRPFEQPLARLHDRHLLLALALLERRGASFTLTALGEETLERVERAIAEGRWQPLPAWPSRR